MNTKPFKDRMNNLTDKELISILEKRNQYQKNAVDAAIEVAESRGLQFEEIKREIVNTRILAEHHQTRRQSKRIEKIIKQTPKAVGIYQIIGGAVLMTFSVSLSLTQVSTFTKFIIPFFAIFSVISGYLLLAKKEKGVLLSIINQSLQVVKFQFFSFGFEYYSPLYLGLEITENLSFGFEIQYGMALIFGPTTYEYDIFFGINILAVVVLYYLAEYKDLIKN